MKVTDFPFADCLAQKSLLSAEAAQFAFAHRHAGPEKTWILLISRPSLLA